MFKIKKLQRHLKQLHVLFNIKKNENNLIINKGKRERDINTINDIDKDCSKWNKLNKYKQNKQQQHIHHLKYLHTSKNAYFLQIWIIFNIYFKHKVGTTITK